MKKIHIGIFLISLLYIGYHAYTLLLSSEQALAEITIFDYIILGINLILIFGLIRRNNILRKINIFLLCLCVLFTGVILLLSIFPILAYAPAELSRPEVLQGIGLHILFIVYCCWIVSIFSCPSVKSEFIASKAV